MSKKVADLLFKKYLEWQNGEGKRLSVVEYAKYLDVSQQTLSTWMNGKNEPRDRKNINKLYEKLGPEIYDVLELDRPSYAHPEIEEGVRELALAIQEIPEEYRDETRNVIMDILIQVVKDSKDNQLVPKQERRSEISDDDLTSAVHSIKKLKARQEDDRENKRTSDENLNR